MQKELKWSSGYTRDAMRNYLGKIYHLMDAAGLPCKRDPSLLSGQPAAD